MVRLHGLITKFGIQSAILINKSDLNDTYYKETVSFAEKNGIPIVGEVPYDLSFTEALAKGETIIEFSHSEISDALKRIWIKIKKQLL